MKLRNIVLMAGCALLVACGGGSTEQPKQEGQQTVIPQNPNPQITKTDAVYMPKNIEGTPIVFNGTLYTVIVDRPWIYYATDDIILIDEVETGRRVASVPMGSFGYISAFVDNGTVYVFGTTDQRTQNVVQMIQSTDLVNWSAPVTVLSTKPGQTFWNTSVAKDADGFVMAYDVSEPGVKEGFTSRFARSTDLINWSPVGGLFDPDHYTACPMIRYVNGYYYSVYLKFVDGMYQEYVSRSADLIHWQANPFPLLTPSAGEGINNSDFDMVEFNGKLIVEYGIGDQTTWSMIKLGTYNGTMQQYFESMQFQ